MFIDDRSYKVKLVSTSNPINDPTDLENIFLKTTDGRFVPVSTIATLTEVAVPPSLSREQQMRASPITAGLSPDFALGSALTRAEEIADAAAAARQPHHPARRSGDARREQRRDADDLRLRHRHHPAGAGGAVRELRQRDHHHGDGAARPRLRGVRAAVHRHQPQRLQPDRPGAAGRRHGQERHPDRRIRQPAARPRRSACARRSSRRPTSGCGR